MSHIIMAGWNVRGKIFSVLQWHSEITHVFVKLIETKLDELCCLVWYAMNKSGPHIHKGEKRRKLSK